jgi:hypothetical protein
VNKEQIFDLLSFLKEVYPGFDFEQSKIDTWHRLLKDQNPAEVMKNAERHSLESKFVPTISDLRTRKHPAYEAEDLIQKIKKWEGEASGKPKH